MKKLVLCLCSINAMAIIEKKSISEQALERMPTGAKTLIQNEYSEMADQLADGDYDADNFLAIYNHESGNQEDDVRYLQMLFNKYSEQAWDEKGK